MNSLLISDRYANSLEPVYFKILFNKRIYISESSKWCLKLLGLGGILLEIKGAGDDVTLGVGFSYFVYGEDHHFYSDSKLKVSFGIGGKCFVILPNSVFIYCSSCFMKL